MKCLKAGIVRNFWHSKSNAEVDFVWEMENRTIAVEAKSKLKREAIPVLLKNFIEKYNPGKIFIVNESLLEKRGSVVFNPIICFRSLFRMVTGDAH